MAISKSMIFSLLVAFLVLWLIQADEITNRNAIEDSPLEEIDCGAKCNVRCSKASRTKMCLKACGTCCQRCKCVPPGTSGNYEVCPCYANLTTHGGRRKCP